MKIKCVGRQEFVIGGWTDPQRSRVGLGALLVGYYEGDRLHYAGKVGTGYTPRRAARPPPPVRRAGPERPIPSTTASRRSARHVHWVEPRARGRDRLCRMDPERPAPPAAIRGPPARQDGQRVPPRAARAGCGRPASKADRLIRPGETTMPLEGVPRQARFHQDPRALRREEAEAAQAADLRRAGAPRLASCITTSASRPTACSRAGRSPRGRRSTRR